MRRWGLLVGVVGLVGLGTLLWPSSEGPEAAGPLEARAPAERRERLAPAAPLRPRGGRVVGLVVREGLPVDLARVTLRAGAPLVSVTREDGRFLFDDVPSGPLYLSASNGEGASEVSGPFEVGPGESVGDVVLVLSPPVRVEGVVVDLVSRAPVIGATVATTHQVSRTDASGRFTLLGARGPTWLDVVAEGFLSRAEWVSLELARAGGRLEVVLTPACRLRGRVTEGGAPVGGATVWAELLEGAGQGTRSTTVFTGRDGDFLVEGTSGLLRLWAVTPRGTRIPGPLLRLAVGEAREGLELSAPEVSAVQGVVTRDGLALPLAALTAIDASSEAVAGVVTSGPDGHFTFAALLNGRYVVQVRAGALVSLAGPFEHRGDGQPWHIAVVGGATLEGRVEPRQAGVRVRWRSGAWPGPVAETVSDAQGQFRFEGLPDELVAVDAEGPGGSATSRARPGDEVVLRLGRGQVVVRMRDDLGQPVTDAVLLARSLETGAVQRQLVLAPDGVTKLGLSEGPWELTLEASGRGRSSTARLQVGPSPVDVELSLERSVSVRGLVRDAATHLPIAGAQIDAVSGGPLSPSRLSVVSDARGEFVLTATPRSARLSVRHPLYQSQARAAGEGGLWEVSLVRAPHETPSAPAFQFEGVGLVLDGGSGVVLVSAVNEGGPAERAGIQRGDAILSVDGAPIAGLSMEQVIQRIRGPAGSAVVLELQRSGQRLVFTVRRRLLTL